MSHSASLPQDRLPAESAQPLILERLPNVAASSNKDCPPRTRQHIDLLLLAMEAFELGASEYMLATIKDLELQGIIKNRVLLWRLRCTNPWRRSYTRRKLKLDEAKALVIVVSHRARQRMVYIRQMLQALQQMQDKGLPLEQHPGLSIYLSRFRTHFRSRMNPRRAKVSAYLAAEEELNQLALDLLSQLLFATGTAGMQRLWISLFDGEVT